MDTITQSRYITAVVIFVDHANIHAANRRLEHDERVSTIVRASWKSLALGAEVCIIADCTFVADTRDVVGRRLVPAERPVAENAIVNFMTLRGFSNRLIDRDEAMIGVVFCRIYGAF